MAIAIASAAHAFDAAVPRTPRLLICVPFRIWSVYVPIWYTLNVCPASELPSAPFRVMVAPAAIAAGDNASPASMAAAAAVIPAAMRVFRFMVMESSFDVPPKRHRTMGRILLRARDARPAYAGG